MEKTMKTRMSKRDKAFTLIELLVVVAIIAVLISILLPAIASARESARATKCAVSMRSVGQAMAGYISEYFKYPASYIYPSDANGSYSLSAQPLDHPYGYLHWSWFLFSSGRVGNDSFSCPTMKNGGLPRTNPGPKSGDWESGQVDQNNNTCHASSLQDKQVPRCSFLANGAIIPRNKLTLDLAQQSSSGAQRYNKMISDSDITEPGNTILATEVFNDFRAASIGQGSNYLVKSHRPVVAFQPISAQDEYQEPSFGNYARFTYKVGTDKTTFGLLPLSSLSDPTGAIERHKNGTEMNAVGRHHGGGDKFGGTANFLYTDGHVDRDTVLNTLLKRRWGDKYFSLTGANVDVIQN
jgi:prepilin-type N-terminal cleavage/methylation domain-containing protein/prepilin-type processing-associated H-X9-DG protein